MMKQNSELRAEARNYLGGLFEKNWLMGALAALVFSAISGVCGGIPFVNIAGILVLLPVAYGFMIMFLKAIRKNEEVNIGSMFDGFSDYGRVLGTLLLVVVYTFLWSLLLCIPGIIKSYSYGMTSYILADRPDLSYNAAIEESMRMMNGYKMKLFLLDLSFIGWILLGALACGVGTFFVLPYMEAARVAFYEDLKAQQEVAA